MGFGARARVKITDVSCMSGKVKDFPSSYYVCKQISQNTRDYGPCVEEPLLPIWQCTCWVTPPDREDEKQRYSSSSLPFSSIFFITFWGALGMHGTNLNAGRCEKKNTMDYPVLNLTFSSCPATKALAWLCTYYGAEGHYATWTTKARTRTIASLPQLA